MTVVRKSIDPDAPSISSLKTTKLKSSALQISSKVMIELSRALLETKLRRRAVSSRLEPQMSSLPKTMKITLMKRMLPRSVAPRIKDQLN